MRFSKCLNLEVAKSPTSKLEYEYNLGHYADDVTKS